MKKVSFWYVYLLVNDEFHVIIDDFHGLGYILWYISITLFQRNLYFSPFICDYFSSFFIHHFFIFLNWQFCLFFLFIQSINTHSFFCFIDFNELSSYCSEISKILFILILVLVVFRHGKPTWLWWPRWPVCFVISSWRWY